MMNWFTAHCLVWTNTWSLSTQSIRRSTDLLLHSFTEIPSILALMSVLLFLMAERTASKRKPGQRSSFRISLWADVCACVCYISKRKKSSKRQKPGAKPLVVVELLLHQEQVGFELVPLEDDVTHLLLGEAWLIWIVLLAAWGSGGTAGSLTPANLRRENRVWVGEDGTKKKEREISTSLIQ